MSGITQFVIGSRGSRFNRMNIFPLHNFNSFLFGFHVKRKGIFLFRFQVIYLVQKACHVTLSCKLIEKNFISKSNSRKTLTKPTIKILNVI